MAINPKIHFRTNRWEATNLMSPLQQSVTQGWTIKSHTTTLFTLALPVASSHHDQLNYLHAKWSLWDQFPPQKNVFSMLKWSISVKWYSFGPIVWLLRCIAQSRLDICDVQTRFENTSYNATLYCGKNFDPHKKNKKKYSQCIINAENGCNYR